MLFLTEIPPKRYENGVCNNLSLRFCFLFGFYGRNAEALLELAVEGGIVAEATLGCYDIGLLALL